MKRKRNVIYEKEEKSRKTPGEPSREQNGKGSTKWRNEKNGTGENI